jgi:hypothetical protein
MFGSVSLNPYAVKNTAVTLTHICSACRNVAPRFVNRVYLLISFLTAKSDYLPVNHYSVDLDNGMVLVVSEVAAESCHVNIH